jgi:hypothetical protein
MNRRETGIGEGLLRKIDNLAYGLDKIIGVKRMRTLVSLAGMGVTGILSFAAWKLCADSVPYWWVFLLTGAGTFIISAAIACAPVNDSPKDEDMSCRN